MRKIVDMILHRGYNMKKLLLAIFGIGLALGLAGCTSANLEKWFELDTGEIDNGREQEANIGYGNQRFNRFGKSAVAIS